MAGDWKPQRTSRIYAGVTGSMLTEGILPSPIIFGSLLGLHQKKKKKSFRNNIYEDNKCITFITNSTINY